MPVSMCMCVCSRMKNETQTRNGVKNKRQFYTVTKAKR